MNCAKRVRALFVLGIGVLTFDLGLGSIRGQDGANGSAGNFLFSTGPNSQGGGKRTTKGHYDVPMRDCTVALDNDVIIERGKLTDAKMQVAFLPR